MFRKDPKAPRRLKNSKKKKKNQEGPDISREVSNRAEWPLEAPYQLAGNPTRAKTRDEDLSETVSLPFHGRGKVAHILPSPNPTCENPLDMLLLFA